MENQKKSKRGVTLSRRLSCVADMVTPGGCVCDVGCDHGFVSIYLIQKRIARHVIAMDVGEGPLSRAKEHVEAYGLGSSIDIRLSDGLSKVTKADGVDTVVMAGMGGQLMERLIGAALHQLRIPEYVLQPQSQWQRLRAFLRKNGYVILQEDMIFEEGKYYPVMRVRTDVMVGSSTASEDVSDVYTAVYDCGGEDVNKIELGDMFGPLLLRDRNGVLKQYLLKEEKKFMEINDRLAAGGRTEEGIGTYLTMLRAALQMYDVCENSSGTETPRKEFTAAYFVDGNSFR